MKADELTDDELALVIKSLSIHRGYMRRKLSKLPPGPAYDSALREVSETQALVSKLNRIELERLAS